MQYLCGLSWLSVSLRQMDSGPHFCTKKLFDKAFKKHMKVLYTIFIDFGQA